MSCSSSSITSSSNGSLATGRPRKPGASRASCFSDTGSENEPSVASCSIEVRPIGVSEVQARTDAGTGPTSILCTTPITPRQRRTRRITMLRYARSVVPALCRPSRCASVGPRSSTRLPLMLTHRLGTRGMPMRTCGTAWEPRRSTFQTRRDQPTAVRILFALAKQIPPTHTSSVFRAPSGTRVDTLHSCADTSQQYALGCVNHTSKCIK